MTPTREEVLSTLKAHEAELRVRGVARVALFGSLARGEARADSDVDLMVEIDPAAGLVCGATPGSCCLCRTCLR